MRAISLAALLLILPCADVRCCQLPVARDFIIPVSFIALVSDPDSFPFLPSWGKDTVSRYVLRLGGVVN